MRKFILLAIIFLNFCLAGWTQRGNNLLGIGLEAGFPTGKFNSYQTGFGFFGKGMLGVGDNGQVTFTTGYSFFRLKGSTSDFKIKTNIIPFLLGYRYNAGFLFIEPAVGYGIYDTRSKMVSGGTTTKSKVSNSGFTTSLTAGVRLNSYHIQAKYQVGYPNGAIGYFGIGLSYNLALQRAGGRN